MIVLPRPRRQGLVRTQHWQDWHPHKAEPETSYFRLRCRVMNRLWWRWSEARFARRREKVWRRKQWP